VTDRDAKALGQPVGSTTTVLLTAYPGGQNGSTATQQDDNMATCDSSSGQTFLTNKATTGNPPNIQVVYSGSTVEALTNAQAATESFPATTSIASSGELQVSAANEYLTAAASQELLEATSNISTIANRGDDGSTDLATQLINQYTAGVEGGSEFVAKETGDAHLIGSTSAELVPLEGEPNKTTES